MAKQMQGLRAAVLMAVMASLTACEPMVDRRGHITDHNMKDWVQVGSTTKDEVLREFGSPSTVSSFGDESWYYVQSRKEARGFLKPEITTQHVLQITFDEQGVVKETKGFDEKDRKEVAMVQKVTPTEGHSMGFFEQVLGNLGRFNKPREMSTPGRR